MDLLNKITNLISAGHKEAVKMILSTLKKRNEITTAREFETEAKRLVANISSGGPVLKPKLAAEGSKLSSKDHNQNMESSYIDLNGLYKQTDLLGTLQTKQKDIMTDEFSKARAAILKLINDARVFAIRNQNPQYDDIKLVNFNISNNTSHTSPVAYVDPDSRLLKLPQILKRRNHLPNREAKSTSITINVIGGKLGQLGKQFSIDNAVDARPETFWAEVIYSDVPINTTYHRWGPNNDGEMTDFINGPHAIITLSYGAAEAINQIKLLPFSNYPIKVLEISYRPNLNSKIRYPISNFTVEQSLDWIEYNFDTVFASDIQIIFAQENYKNIIIHVPKSVLYATDFLIRLQETRLQNIAEIPNLNDVNLGGNDNIYSEAISDLKSLLVQKDLQKTPITEIDTAGKTILSIGESLTAFNPDLGPLLQDVTNYTNALPKDVGNQIEVINKSEYIIGAREIETSYVIYSPIGYYESEKFEPASTISNIELEVDERHPIFKSQYGTYNKTSTEWEIELANDRVIPIFPKNLEEAGLLPVKGERLNISPYTFYGYSRFKAYTSWVLVRENDALLVANVDYSVIWDGTYNGVLQIQINKSRFDAGKLYTIDYYADPSCKSIDVLATFKDKALATPDTFNGTTVNNSVKLTSFPYVNYNIINSDSFEYVDVSNSYQYNAPTGSYSTGLIHIQPEWFDTNGVTITGISGSFTGSAVSGVTINWSSLNSIYFNDPYNYYLKITNAPGATFKITSFVNSGTLTLESIPRLYTGLIGHEIPLNYFSGNFTGIPPSGYIEVPYSIDVIYNAGEQKYGYDNLLYSPLNITVGGVTAKNITSYQDIEQPAFNVANAKDGEFEYIHDGRTIYFNQPIPNSTEIKVDYRWMTQYVKVNCLLRANKPVSPTITPQVNEFRLLLNTTIL